MRAALNATLECLGGAFQGMLVFVQPVEHGIEFLRQLGQFVLAVEMPDTQLTAFTDAVNHAVHPAHGAGEGIHAANHHQAGDQHDHGQDAADLEQRFAVQTLVRRQGEAGVDHADALTGQRGKGRIGRHVPPADHEGVVDEAFAARQHLLADGLRDASAQGALAVGQAHVGSDAHIVEKQGHAARGALGQRAGSVDQVANLVDRPGVAIEQAATVQQQAQMALGVTQGRQRAQHHAARFMPSFARGCLRGLAQRQACALGQTRCQCLEP